MMASTDTFLGARIRIPVQRSGVIVRKRLQELLNLGLGNRLTLLSAPAGYGKTTLLCEWIANQKVEVKFAWLSLDEAMNNASIFFQYVIAALQIVDPDIGQSILPALQVPNPPNPEGFLTPLLNQISQKPDRICLVLDDYHLITDPSIHQITTRLIEQESPGCHVVISTRADPPLPIYRFRARGELTELRQAQLSFTLEETREFLQQTVGNVFKPEDIDLLYRRTEGWVVGLLLAGLSLQESEDISEAVAKLTGNQVYIMEYLANEVLNHQPERIRDFLLKTSILARLTGPLCDQLTGFNDGYVTLESLKARNLFVSALDNEQIWYRYHQLFADLLRRRLEREHKGALPNLHKAASDWYSQNGFLPDAIDHAILSGDYVFAASLIEKHAETMWSRGEQAILLKQFKNLPIEISYSSVPLCLWYSVLLFFDDQHKQARALLQSAEALIRSDPALSVLHLESVLGTQALHQAYLALLDLNLDEVIEHAQQALEHLPKDWQTLHHMAQMMLADASNWRGDAIKAGQMYSELLGTNTLLQNPNLFFTIGIRSALQNLSCGRLHQVYDFCLQSLQQLAELKPRLAQFERFFHVILTDIFIEWDRLEEVQNRLDFAFDQFKRTERSSWDILYLSIVRGYITLNQIAPARYILKLLEDGIRSSQLPRPYLNDVLAWKARIHLLEGNVTLAEEVLSELGQIDCARLASQDEAVCLMIVRVWLKQGKFHQAIESLKMMQANPFIGGRINVLISILILRAAAETMQKHLQVARDNLARALSLAEPEGFIRIFVEQGTVIGDLLKEMVSAGHGSPYIRQLIEAFGNLQERTENKRTQNGEIEPFSGRELQVLRFLVTHLSQREMAEELCVSVNTIRFHIKNIYGKLGVHDRSEAVEKAKMSGLL